jgi:AraC family transcriptional regulator
MPLDAPALELLDNHRQARRKGGVLDPATPILSGAGFSAQVLDEHDTETDVPALDRGVLIQILSHRPRVWTDLMGRRTAFDVASHSFVYVPAGRPSWWKVAGCGGLMLHMTFDHARFRALAADEGPGGGCEPGPLICRRDRTLDTLTRLLVGEMRYPRPNSLLTDALALNIQIALLRLPGGLPSGLAMGGLAGSVLRRVVDYVAANLARDITMAELAGIAGLSPYHFARAFKRSTGVPPHRYQIMLRVERAKELLAHSTWPITDIAAAIGYDDPGQLARIFRREVGTTPSRYRREVRD